MNNQTCVACGMPMQKDADHAGGDSSKNYCHYCVTDDGSMVNYEQALEKMTQFTIDQKGLEKTTALKIVKEAMKQLPAWKDHQ
jgi:hypothetical protein